MTNSSVREFFLVPVEWVSWALIAVAISGMGMGMLSFVFPEHSIRLYQFLMKCCSWRAEPLDPTREVRSTRWLGLLMFLLSLSILIVLLLATSKRSR